MGFLICIIIVSLVHLEFQLAYLFGGNKNYLRAMNSRALEGEIDNKVIRCSAVVKEISSHVSNSSREIGAAKNKTLSRTVLPENTRWK